MLLSRPWHQNRDQHQDQTVHLVVIANQDPGGTGRLAYDHS
jgi:hypothetical protein